MASVNRLRHTIRQSEAQIQSLQRQDTNLAEIAWVWSESGRPETSLEAVNHLSSFSQTAFISSESARDKSKAIFDAEGQKCQDLEDILTEVWRCLDNHSTLLHSAHEMFCQDVDWIWHDQLRPLFDAAGKGVVAFRSVSTCQVETHDETLHQSASSIVSYFDLRLSSFANVSDSDSPICNPFGPDDPSSAQLFSQRIFFDTIQQCSLDSFSFLIFPFVRFTRCCLSSSCSCCVLVVFCGQCSRGWCCRRCWLIHSRCFCRHYSCSCHHYCLFVVIVDVFQICVYTFISFVVFDVGMVGSVVRFDGFVGVRQLALHV